MTAGSGEHRPTPRSKRYSYVSKPHGALRPRRGRPVNKLRTYLNAVWNRYRKPIWLTEFALWQFPSVFPTPRGQAAFVTAATTMLRRLPYIWRYEWFALPANGTDGTAGLFRPGALPTATGRAYEKVP